MPSIALPTAEKQDEILTEIKKFTKGTEKTYLLKDFKVTTIATDNDTDTYVEVLNINGSGELVELSLQGKSSTTGMGIRITIDDNVFISKVCNPLTNNRPLYCLLNKDEFMFIGTTNSLFSALTGRNRKLYDTSNAMQIDFFENKIFFEKKLKVEAFRFQANGTNSEIIYRLT